MSVSFLVTYRYIGLLFLWSYGFFIMTVYGSMDYFVAFFLESLFITLVVALLAQMTRLPKWLEKLSYLFFFSLVLIQIQAMHSSDTYLTILALNNADAAPMLAIPFGMIWPFLINVALYVFTPKLDSLEGIKKMDFAIDWSEFGFFTNDTPRSFA